MFEKIEVFLVAVLAMFTRIAVATESIAKSLDGAKLSSEQAPAKVPASPAAPAPPPPPPPPAPEADDLGLGLEEPPKVEDAKVTKEALLKMARDKATEKGRDFVKEVLKTCGYANVKEIKEADYKKVFDALAK